MLHPSYNELMEKINENVDIGDEPVVNSRYSIVCATAKRARQIIDGDEPLVEHYDYEKKKPLSIAVEEMDKSLLKIQTAEEKKETEEIDRIMAKQMERKIPDDNPIVINEPKDEELDVDTSVLAMNRENETVSKLVPLSDDGGEVILLIEGDTRIGRKKSLCDYCIDDSSVSRVHAIISKNDKVVRVRDAGSTNGTFINDRRIEVDEVLEANIGDLISIAGLQYECC